MGDTVSSDLLPHYQMTTDPVRVLTAESCQRHADICIIELASRTIMACLRVLFP